MDNFLTQKLLFTPLNCFNFRDPNSNPVCKSIDLQKKKNINILPLNTLLTKRLRGGLEKRKMRNLLQFLSNINYKGGGIIRLMDKKAP